MDVKKESLELGKETITLLIECGTQIDDIYRRFRELRLRCNELSFQSALLNVEHAFFMVVQSMNILREQIKLLEVAKEKKEVE